MRHWFELVDGTDLLMPKLTKYDNIIPVTLGGCQ